MKEKPGAAFEAKQELRKAHFSYGSSSLAGGETFATTNQEKLRMITEEQSQSLRKPIDYGTSIYYGRDSPIYQSMSKDTMIRHSI